MNKYLLSILVLLCCSLGSKAQKWDTYPTYETYITYMQQIAKDHSDICRLDTIGTSVENRLILCLKFSSEPNNELNKPKFFYSSSMHGNELTGAIMLLKLIDSLVINPQLITTLPVIYICPFANPDGTWHGGNNSVNGAIRYNANYVDLNRNFPDIRSGNNSDGEVQQKETTAFITYQTKERFNMSCNLHTGSEVFNYPWDSYRSNKKAHADKDWFELLGNDFVSRINDNTHTYFTDVNDSGIIDGGDWYVIYGSRQDWSTYFAHCREVTLELSMDYTPIESSLNDYWYKVKDALFTFFDYCSLGFQGVVTDSITNNPISDVMISINSHDKDSSEVFSNGNGYYSRPILNGNYVVTFSKEGFYSKTMEIAINSDISNNDVQLVPIKTSLNGIDSLNVSIYPLPTKDILNIQTDRNVEYKILDLNGRIIDNGYINAPLSTINIKKLQVGTYIISICDNKTETINKKFIKQ